MSGTEPAEVRASADPRPPAEAAEELLVALKTGSDPTSELETLASYDEAALEQVRADREYALAFWLNLYNAGTQLLLERRTELYESPLRSLLFFRADAVTVAGHALSLDEIEHGILRGRHSKYGLGYLPRFPRRVERRYAIKCDPRIHFACNCGAASCPAVRAYKPDSVDDQLDLATEVYLDDTVEYDAESGVAHVPRVFLWYRGDFGGKSGMLSMLRAYEAIPDDASPKLRYNSWNGEQAKGKFADR